MPKKLKTIGQLSQERAIELLMEYDQYTIEFFSKYDGKEDTFPLTAHEYYEEEFVEYAKEKEFIDELYIEEEVTCQNK